MEKIHIHVEGGRVDNVYYESAPGVNLVDNGEVVIHDLDILKVEEGFDCPRCGTTGASPQNDGTCGDCGRPINEPLQVKAP